MICEKEYAMLRSEMEDNIKKQDSAFVLIFTILGLSNVFSAWSENIAYLLFILFATILIQIKITEYRNVVYYISTYLHVKEDSTSIIQWEKNIREFKKWGMGFHPNCVL